MNLSPLKFADSSKLEQFEPLITVGHPAYMARTGPFVTSVGSFSATSALTRTQQWYQLPADNGASGSGVINLRGELVGQIMGGGAAFIAESEGIAIEKHGLLAVELDVEMIGFFPAPFAVKQRVPISPPLSQGAPSNYIRHW
jgi:S1-C subfamily serine protease